MSIDVKKKKEFLVFENKKESHNVNRINAEHNYQIFLLFCQTVDLKPGYADAYARHIFFNLPVSVRYKNVVFVPRHLNKIKVLMV